MDLFNYIKKNYETPNPYVVKSLGGSEELVEYLRNTPWNTNLNILSAYEGGGESADCKRTDLGMFMYCGSLKSGNYSPEPWAGGQEDWEDGVKIQDMSYWVESMFGETGTSTIVGVFDGNEVSGIVVSGSEVRFGDYLIIGYETDAETGSNVITCHSASDSLSHYALYSTLPMN